jgi:hypothetical protein
MKRLDELRDQLGQLNEMIRVGELQGDAARKARDTLEAEVLAAVLRRDAGPAPLAATARPSGRLIAACWRSCWWSVAPAMRGWGIEMASLCHLERVRQPTPALRPMNWAQGKSK